jgi:four helix bundle protein
MNKFKELKVWQKTIQLVTKIYSHTSNFPKEEMYGIVSQIRRCAVSIPSNIAGRCG